jgi:hypothetical protein
MESVLAESQAGGPVNMTSKLQEMGIDNLVRMIFAKPHMGATECLTREEMVTLKGVVKEAVNLAGHIYAGDFIPLLDIYDFTVPTNLPIISSDPDLSKKIEFTVKIQSAIYYVVDITLQFLQAVTV